MASTPSTRPFLLTRGTWPGPVTFRRGWSRAEARPWNDSHPDAHLRMVRGGTTFLTACVETLEGWSTPAVLSPPLTLSAAAPWREAGFEEHLRLSLLRLELDRKPPAPDHLVGPDRDGDRPHLLAIDRAAFGAFWAFDDTGLSESIEAAASSETMVVRDGDGHPIGYAVLGYGHALSYLQRVAVHPDWQGQGIGRSLIRVAARKAHAAGASAILLNTQPDNEPAIALYRSENYAVLPNPLVLLRHPLG